LIITTSYQQAFKMISQKVFLKDSKASSKTSLKDWILVSATN